MYEKTCIKCNLLKPITEFRKPPEKKNHSNICNDCTKLYHEEYRKQHPHAVTDWKHRTGRTIPHNENKNCPQYLGSHVAERLLALYFGDVKRMPITFPGYDFLCPNGYKIDVKASTLQHHKRKTSSTWSFHIGKNTIADYFMCLAFNNRDSLEPQHLWLIPGNIVNHLTAVEMYPTEYSLNKWSKYEKDLTKVFECCKILKK